MIIVFQGTREGRHGTAAAMVTAAAFQMARSNKKIAILSFCDNVKKNNIENFAFTTDDLPDVGNPLAELGDFEFSDTGIDALIRRSETGILSKEHFNTCSMPAVKAQNGLDIVGTTNTENFEDDMALRFDVAKKVLTVAEELYDYVFVLADSQHEELTKKLDEAADKIVVVVRQGKVDASFSFPDDIKNKISVMVADYEPESSFGTRYLKNSCKVKQIFTMPHSVTYRDACTSGSLIRFALRNASLEETPGDINYAFSVSMKALLDHVCGKAEESEEQEEDHKEEQKDDELPVKTKEKKKRARKMRRVTEDIVRTETVAEKKKLFKKQETYDRVVIGKDNLEQGEQVVDETMQPEAERGDYVLNESPITHGEAREETSEEENPTDEEMLDSVPDNSEFEDADEVSENDDTEEDADTGDTSEKQDEPASQKDPVEDATPESGYVKEVPSQDPERTVEKADESEDAGIDIFAAPEEIPVDEPEVPEKEEGSFFAAPTDIPQDDEKKEETPAKKKKSLFSIFRKKRTNIYEADFSGLKDPTADSIDADIQKLLDSADVKADHADAVKEDNAVKEETSSPVQDSEPEVQTEEGSVVSEEAESVSEEEPVPDAATEEAKEEPAAKTEESEEYYDAVPDEAEPSKEESAAPAEAKASNSMDIFGDDEESGVPVLDGAPRKLSRREKRLLREAIHPVQ